MNDSGHSAIKFALWNATSNVCPRVASPTDDSLGDWEPMLTGKVSRIESGLIYVQLDNGQECLFEPINAYDIKVGDFVTGNLRSCGGQMILNKSKRYPMNVFIHSHLQA